MRKQVLTGEQIEEARVAYHKLVRDIPWRRESIARLVAMLERELPRQVDRYGLSLMLIEDRQKLALQEAELERLTILRRCGARTRRGTPCQCQPEPGRDRCKLHGGKSTGPRSEAGREAVRESNRRRAATVRGAPVPAEASRLALRRESTPAVAC